MASLDSVEQKIVRAAEHFQSLESEVQRYFQANPGKLVREPNTPDNEILFSFGGPVPSRFGLIIGDCIQNLRSSLDYLVWELVLAANNQPGKHNMFPICSSPDIFKDALSNRKRLLGVHPDAIAEIEALQPYHLGMDFKKAILWALDELANLNKHCRIPVTDLAARETMTDVSIDKDGRTWMNIPAGPVPTLDRDAKFGPYPVVGGQVQMNSKLVAGIAFGEGAAKGIEISMSLNLWLYYIREKVIPIFERFF